MFCDFFSLSGYLNMAAVRERITFTLEDVLELVGEENTPNSLDFDSSESELEDDVVPAISAEVNDIIDENPESAGEESDSSAESEGDRRETIRNQRQQGQDNFGSALLTLIRQIEVVEGEEGQGKQGELEWLVKLEKSKMAASSMFGQKKRTEEL